MMGFLVGTADKNQPAHTGGRVQSLLQEEVVDTLLSPSTLGAHALQQEKQLQ